MPRRSAGVRQEEVAGRRAGKPRSRWSGRRGGGREAPGAGRIASRPMAGRALRRTHGSGEPARGDGYTGSVHTSVTRCRFHGSARAVTSVDRVRVEGGAG
ncbi:Hypothetical protein CAP_1470 [Chondromyces apiculatus DSM 436]|uniref:Uncharacterized protein n=1 Tax=Chondromyces apiculatus DSM 436 TaxID=1192034 RepID=A0A017TBV3_9BACT|nr:Hypothetical protein CAP_1470 [Chondromyces apiculatus DSM 436]